MLETASTRNGERLRGWFRVLGADDLPKGAVRTVRLAGRDRVLFRTSTGAIGATEPICPHLGAHLGHGGTVQDDQLRCPFHGFRFGLDGTCRSTEHCASPPSRARLGVYPVREWLGQIFVFDAERPMAPTFLLPELSLEGLTTPRYTTLSFAGRVEDFAENGVDLGHFGAVHHYSNVRDVAIRHEGPRLHTRFRFDRQNPLGPVPKVITSVFDTVIHGLGCSVTELHVETLGMRMRLHLLATQVEPGRVDFTVGLSLRLPEPLAKLPREVTDRTSAPVVALFLSHVTSDIAQDRAIWAHRAALERPALAPEDAEIARFRRFIEQFRAA